MKEKQTMTKPEAVEKKEWKARSTENSFDATWHVRRSASCVIGSRMRKQVPLPS